MRGQRICRMDEKYDFTPTADSTDAAAGATVKNGCVWKWRLIRCNLDQLFLLVQRYRYPLLHPSRSRICRCITHLPLQNHVSGTDGYLQTDGGFRGHGCPYLAYREWQVGSIPCTNQRGIHPRYRTQKISSIAIIQRVLQRLCIIWAV